MSRPKFCLIVYDHGRRIERDTRDFRGAMELAERLNAKEGVKAHVAARTNVGIREYPHGSLDPMNDGMLWCPYCRRWRWFGLPKRTRGAEVGSSEWMLNSLRDQEIQVCMWCQISELDFYVCRANGLSQNARARRKHRNVKRRRK